MEKLKRLSKKSGQIIVSFLWILLLTYCNVNTLFYFVILSFGKKFFDVNCSLWNKINWNIVNYNDHNDYDFDAEIEKFVDGIRIFYFLEFTFFILTLFNLFHNKVAALAFFCLLMFFFIVNRILLFIVYRKYF